MRRFPAVQHGILVVVLSAACAPATRAPSPSGVAADVAYLASRQLAGRGAGSRGGDSAAAYIVRQYQRLGLPGPYRGECRTDTRCASAYLQHFDLGGDTAQNVVAIVTGSDPSLRREYIVVGAHYDHLGESSFASRDPELGAVVRPGADDNASGSAAVLELARRLAARPPRRSVLLVHFDAEELGLVGSRVFVRSPPVPIATMVAVMLSSGLHDDYHRRSDLPSRVDAAGILRVVDVAEGVIRLADERAPTPTEVP